MSTSRNDYRFFERLRVRWAEVDLQQIVFNGHYLMYFDTAVAGYWRAMALPYAETLQALDGDIFVRKTTVDYLASARYDDLIDVGVRTARIGNSSIVIEGAVFRADQCLVTGELLYVFADPATQTSRPVPDSLRAIMLGFEAGEPMVTVRQGSWDAMRDASAPIRQQVFIDEQRIPPELEWDDADATSVHAVAVNRMGRPLATGRLLRHAPGVARIGRLAVLPMLRGSGVGRQLLEHLMQAARERGDTEAVLDAQTSAMAFYARAGFTPRGEVFDDAGIPHIEMVRPI
jgi:YbgC/YbaW family acyl-CoA thioester hydrolase